jgi:hypothetical protein
VGIEGLEIERPEAWRLLARIRGEAGLRAEPVATGAAEIMAIGTEIERFGA